MNTQQLECFICVADKLNFTKAAEELFLSTPTVTHHIKNLEKELGTKLFIRNSRMVQLTDNGKIFYGDAKEILDREYVARKKLIARDYDNLSFFKIACSSHVELIEMESILRNIREKLPNIYPRILVKDYSIIRNLFKDGNINLALVTRDMIKDIDCKFKLIKKIKTYAIFSKDYKINGENIEDSDSLSFSELKSECLITLSPKYIPFKQGNVLQENLTLHSKYGLNIVCDSDTEVIQLARSGYGVAILPENTIPKILDDVIIKVISDQSSFDYGLAYQKDADDERTKFFIENFK